MAQYLALIYDDEKRWADGGPEVEAASAGHRTFGERNGEAIVGGNALMPTSTATTVRSDGGDGFTVTDGPWLETKEALGGYYLLEASDLDAAIELAKQIPVVAGGIEVRPIMVLE
jgi:hypothetical protein